MTAKNEDEAQDALEALNKRTGRNMPQAIATGAVLVILVVGILLLSTHAFAYLIIVFMVLAIWELRVDFATIGIHIPPLALWFCSILMLLCTYYFNDHMLALGASLILSLFIVSLSAAFNPFSGSRVHRVVEKKTVSTDLNAQYRNPELTFLGRLGDVCVSIFALLYIPLLAAFLVMMLTQTQPHIKVMMAIFIPSLGDTGGLIFGSMFGKHKLSPRISPKKSYEGLAGSILFAVVGSLLFYGFAFQDNFLEGGWWKPVVMGIVIAFTGTFGDLSASMLKRDLGIKDMGHLLKGHGGILDRVDSVLISTPFFFLMFALFGV